MGDYEGLERLTVFFANWVALLLAPIWAPLWFWALALTHKNFLSRMVTGKKGIWE
jgi:hypothetical protein